MGKKLLNEATVRKFMKLANIDRLTDTFVNEAYHAEEEELEEGMHDEDMHAEGEHEEGMYAEAAHDEMAHAEDMHAEGEHEGDELDMDAEAEVEDTSEASIEALVDALADTITQVTGVEVTASGDAEAPEDMGPVDDAPVDDMGDMMGDEADEGGEDLDAAPEDEEVLEAMHGEEEELDEDAIVAETMRRVKARLRKMDKSEKLVESLTQKIYDRLANNK
jgi:hypothetical protein|tara:strand:+ start:772 stop:1431 length:660 start_codon:yes stop_codon:yes gene_type:complete